MKIIKWNTGRWYTEHGQRIAAGLLKNGKVGMVDIDRGIFYQYNCELTREAVMHAYDYNLEGDFFYGPEQREIEQAALTVESMVK